MHDRFRVTLAVFAILSLAALLSIPASAQTPPTPPPFSSIFPPPVNSPASAVTVTNTDPLMHPGAYRITTPYMFLASGNRMQNWWVKADGSGTISVTLVAGQQYFGRPCRNDPSQCNPYFAPYAARDVATAAAFDVNGNPVPGASVSVQMPQSSPPANTASFTFSTTPGAVYRVQVNGPLPLPPPNPPAPQIMFRLKFDGAQEAGVTGSPASVAGGFQPTENGLRWVMNVAAGEDLHFWVTEQVNPQGPPAPPQTTFVQIFDPNHVQHFAGWADATYPWWVDFTIPASEVGNLAGPWVVLVVQPYGGVNYRLSKDTGIDQGVYTPWITAGEAWINAIINAPPVVPSVQITETLDDRSMFAQDDGAGTHQEPTNVLLGDSFSLWPLGTPDQGHLIITPPAGWIASPSQGDGGTASDEQTMITINILPTSGGLCSLVQQYVANKGLANSLCVKLDAAADAQARGNMNAKAGALRAFDNEVQAQSGKALTPAQASLLMELAGEL